MRLGLLAILTIAPIGIIIVAIISKIIKGNPINTNTKGIQQIAIRQAVIKKLNASLALAIATSSLDSKMTARGIPRERIV
ncbi:MAG: hypothetical protein AAFY16_09105 [Cyanobacteria bacterium J06642_3]